jgi:hypothetical protein
MNGLSIWRLYSWRMIMKGYLDFGSFVMELDHKISFTSFYTTSLLLQALSDPVRAVKVSRISWNHHARAVICL